MPVTREWAERFAAKVGKQDKDGCIPWLGSRLPKGYGAIKVPKQRRQEYAHRLAWRIHHGDIPDGVQVLHRCDHPWCVNVDHLFLGSQADNMADMKAKSRSTIGGRNPNVRLLATDVVKIKAMLRTGAFSQREIGLIFGVAQVTINKIATGKTWAHVK
jgi:predicted XRE-type DNA-binding protein